MPSDKFDNMGGICIHCFTLPKDHSATILEISCMASWVLHVISILVFLISTIPSHLGIYRGMLFPGTMPDTEAFLNFPASHTSASTSRRPFKGVQHFEVKETPLVNYHHSKCIPLQRVPLGMSFQLSNNDPYYHG